MMENAQTSRREFLVSGLLTTLAASCSSDKHPFTPDASENITPSGKMVKLLSVDGEVVEVDQAFLKPLPDMHFTPSESIREGVPGKKFVMVIDLARCGNARKCVEGCQKMHSVLPPTEWIKVKEMQNADITGPYWFPQPCYQCDNPPCTKVCPVDATFKRTDGIVTIDNERCIGCKFCMAACPYSSRSFNFGDPKEKAYYKEHSLEPHSCNTSNAGMEGTVSKCDFCPGSAEKGELPACVTSCPNGVIFFGDENEDTVSNGDTTMRLSEFLRDRAAYRQFEELGTKPRVYYLPPVNRNFPFQPDTVAHNVEG